jgi:hypothetical protein
MDKDGGALRRSSVFVRLTGISQPVSINVTSRAVVICALLLNEHALLISHTDCDEFGREGRGAWPSPRTPPLRNRVMNHESVSQSSQRAPRCTPMCTVRGGTLVSFQSRGTYDVVACDACNTVGAVGDRRFRVMRRDAAGATHHLCDSCRVWAEWCDTHQRFHMPNDLHRRACADCGGLFTSRVRQRIRHCPSCLRQHAPATTTVFVPVKPTEPAPRGLAGLMAALRKR